MEDIPEYYLLYVLIGCVLALLAIWSRRRLVVRLAAVGMLLILMLTNYSALLDLLGKPLPFRYAGVEELTGDAIVLAASIDEGIAIYLWLRVPDQRQPRYYRIAWNHDAALSLKKALDRSYRDNSTVMMNPNFETSLEVGKEPLFYILPPERLPLKPPPEVYEYRHPGNPVL